MRVGLVIVSHSERIAGGVVDLAAQMAPDVVLVPAGGVPEGSGAARIGTSLELVQAGIERASAGGGAVVLTDLGSAVMTAEMALEFLDPDARSTVRLARAALVEGAVAAAVRAQGGGSLEEVLRAAEEAVVSIRSGDRDPDDAHAHHPDTAGEDPAVGDSGTARGSWVLPNQMGLHARPAAVLATGLADLDAEVSVNGVDGKSMVLLMTLGLGQGRTVTVEASGPDAQAAVDLVGRAVETGFGEPS